MSLALVFVLLLSLLVGCGGGTKDTSTGTTGNTSSADVDGDKPHITFYHGYFQDDWQPAIEMRQLYADFAEANKDKFTFEAIALDTGNEGVYEKCIQEIAGGSFPDMVDVAGFNIIPAAVEAGFALDLKPYIDEDADFKAGVGINYEQNMIDGHIYTVRDQLETIGFWYNEDLFDKAGAALPEDWDTWDDFSKAVEALVASPEVETPFTMNQRWPTNLALSGYLLGSEEGREFATTEPTTFDNDAFRGAIDFLRDDVLGEIDNEHFTAADSDAYRTDFFEGKAAMLFNGVWESGSFGDVEIDSSFIKPAMFPTQEAGKKAAIVSASPGFVINSTMDEAKIEACVEFVKFMTSADTATLIFEKVQAMPPSSAVDYDAYIDGDYEVTVKSLASACKAASEADYQAPTASSAWGADIADAVAGKYAGIKDGSKTTEEIIEELDSTLD